MGCGQRKLAPSVMSVTNDKDDNKMIPGAVHRSLCISLMAEENHGKLQLEDIFHVEKTQTHTYIYKISLDFNSI